MYYDVYHTALYIVACCLEGYGGKIANPNPVFQ